MEERPLPPAPSVSDSFINILASPSTLFEGFHLKASAPSLWAVPLIVSVLFIGLFMYVQFNISPFKEQMMDAQRAAIQKMVERGTLTQEQADAAAEGAAMRGSTQMAIGMAAAVIMMLIFFFLGGLLLWLAAKVALKAPINYGKTLELYGISNWIGIIGGVVTLMLMFALGTMHGRPAASLAVMDSFDLTNTTHKYLAALDVFAIWQTAIIGIAFSKISGKSMGVSMGVVFGLWIVWVVARVMLGFGG